MPGVIGSTLPLILRSCYGPQHVGRDRRSTLNAEGWRATCSAGTSPHVHKELLGCEFGAVGVRRFWVSRE